MIFHIHRDDFTRGSTLFLDKSSASLLAPVCLQDSVYQLLSLFSLANHKRQTFTLYFQRNYYCNYTDFILFRQVGSLNLSIDQ